LSSEHFDLTEVTNNLVRLRRKPIEPWHQDMIPADDVGIAGMERSSYSTSPHPSFTLSSHSLDRERASSKPGPSGKEAKTAAKSSGFAFWMIHVTRMDESCYTQY